jgi:hypothetical protein
MKNLIKYLSVSIVASVLLSSCGSNFSITKRHYNNGYYIDYTRNNKAVPNAEEKTAQVKTQTPSISEQAPVEGNTTNQIQPQSNKQNNALGIFSNSKKEAKANLQTVTKTLPINKVGFAGSNAAKDKQASFEAPNVIANSADRDDGRALSFLWLVIVIILIIWLIAIIAGGFGLGGLINLLLLIALILLILWLLRII